MDDAARKEIGEIVEKKMDKPDKRVPDDIFDKPKAMDPEEKIEDRAAALVSELHDKAMLKIVMEDESIRNMIFDQSQESIGHEIGIIGNQSKKKHQDSSYDLNREACTNYGVDESVPDWQQKMMVAGSSFWFVIYFIFASISIAPVSVFNRGLKTFFKKNWITIPISIICYLVIVVGIPLLIKFINI